MTESLSYRTSKSICSANQCTGFYMIETSVINELNSNVNSKIYFAEITFLIKQLLIKQSWFLYRFTRFLTIVVT